MISVALNDLRDAHDVDKFINLIENSHDSLELLVAYCGFDQVAQSTIRLRFPNRTFAF